MRTSFGTFSTESTNIFIANKIRQIFNRSVPTGAPTNRTILIKNDYSALHLVLPTNLSVLEFTGIPVIATENYDSCNQSLKIKDKTALESLI